MLIYRKPKLIQTYTFFYLGFLKAFRKDLIKVFITKPIISCNKHCLGLPLVHGQKI